MIERHRGRVVNLTSYVARPPSPYQSGYAAAKAGLASLTEALAASLEPHGVHAFAVSPAFTDTEMTRVARQSDAGARWLPGFGEGRVVDAEALGGADHLARRWIRRCAQRSFSAYA